MRDGTALTGAAVIFAILLGVTQCEVDDGSDDVPGRTTPNVTFPADDSLGDPELTRQALDTTWLWTSYPQREKLCEGWRQNSATAMELILRGVGSDPRFNQPAIQAWFDEKCNR